MEYRIQAATEEDEPFLKELFFDARAAEFAPLRLPEPALAQLMEMQYRAQKSGYAQQFPAAESSIVWMGPYRVGRMVVSVAADAIRLVDIALLTPFRGSGMGGRLIEGLCHRARETGLPLRLSVRAANRAVNLYKRLGFVPRSQTAMDIEMEWGGASATETANDHQAGQQQASEEQAPNSEPVTPGLTGAYFRGIRGRTVVCNREGAEPLLLKLANVNALRKDPNPVVDAGDSFALSFEADAKFMLPQGIYELEFDDGYRAGIFLVPLAAANGVVTYESVFNRMQRRPAQA
jgi:GNAT superfamily N-acetyltransferase